MPRRTHPKQQVREVLLEATAAGFDVNDTSKRGHGWGYIGCLICRQKFSVWSTPKNADNHASQIRRFIRRHNRHEENE
jgi:uncharacterized protein (UPF0335 family)